MAEHVKTNEEENTNNPENEMSNVERINDIITKLDETLGKEEIKRTSTSVTLSPSNRKKLNLLISDTSYHLTQVAATSIDNKFREFLMDIIKNKSNYNNQDIVDELNYKNIKYMETNFGRNNKKK